MRARVIHYVEQATAGPHSPGCPLPRTLASLPTLFCVTEVEVRDVTPGTTAYAWPSYSCWAPTNHVLSSSYEQLSASYSYTVNLPGL